MNNSREITRKLKDVFGFSSFRENQEGIVRAVLQGRDVFAVMPTGGGKSLCYQLPALLMEGTCVVISPLISLMKDQVDSAESIGIRAAFINSSMSSGRRMAVMQQFRKGGLDLLYMAPERLAAGDPAEMLPASRLSFIAIDEAHCISEWGHDFRPDYLALSRLREIMPEVPLAAFTATATDRVQQDIISRLSLKEPLVVRASFNRPNLFYRVETKENPLARIARFIRKRPDESGIVYRLTRADVEKTARYLSDQGIRALPYHAGLDPGERSRNQELFNRDEIQVIVATVAFGMGIDKSNIRFVIHGDLPKNMEGYYQETGRAGRDGEPAQCLLLYSRGDMARARHFIDQVENENERRAALEKLHSMGSFAESPICRRRQLLAYFGEELPGDNCGACDVCAHGVEQVDATVDAQIVMSAMYRTGQRFGAAHIVDVVTGSNTKRVRQYGHDRIKTYGAGRGRPKSYWRSVVEALLAQECIRQVGASFPVLEITSSGEDVLYGRSGFAMTRLVSRVQEPSSMAVPDHNQELFDILRRLRMTMAQQEDVPPFVIFSDRSLREMSSFFPDRPEEMLNIHGVGKAKLEKYGRPFISEIAAFLENHPECLRNKPEKTAAVPDNAGREELGDTVRESGRLAARGLSIAEIAKARGLKESTVSSHIEKFLEHGGQGIDIDKLVAPSVRMRLEEQFGKHGTAFLKPVVEAMDGEAGYEEAKIVRGYLRGMQGDSEQDIDV